MLDSRTTDEKTGAERRRAPRRELDYDLNADVHGENVLYTGLIKDISEGGLFIATHDPHRIGQELRIRFTFPPKREAVEVTARVCWFRDEFTCGGQPIGIGVQFVDLAPEAARQINAYIKDKDVHVHEDGM